MTWMRFYYTAPTPDRFVPEVRAMATETLGGPSAAVIATFLGLVMRAHPARIAGWFDELRDLDGVIRESLHIAAVIADVPEARAVLARSKEPQLATASTPDVLTIPIDDGALLDVLWAYFFATGDPQAVRRIVSTLEHMSDYGAAARFRETKQTDEDRARAMRDALFQAASWSLESLAKEHPPLLAVYEQIFESETLTPNERVGLALVMQRVDPVRWDVVIDPAGSATVSSNFRGGAT